MSDMRGKPWKQEEIDKMLELCKQNYSAGKIGKVLNRPRNSIIGKLNRLGYKRVKKEKTIEDTAAIFLGFQKPSSSKKKLPVVKSPVAIPSTPVKESQITIEPNAQNVLFSELVLGQCCFIIGNNSDGKAICCGGEAVKKEYCQTHLDLCYI